MPILIKHDTVFRSSLFRFTKSHGIGYGMNSAAASKKLGAITIFETVHESFKSVELLVMRKAILIFTALAKPDGRELLGKSR
jgi:hypothetical protein